MSNQLPPCAATTGPRSNQLLPRAVTNGSRSNRWLSHTKKPFFGQKRDIVGENRIPILQFTHSAPPRPQPLHPSAHHALPRHPAATPSSLRVKLRCLCHVLVVAVTATTRCHRVARWRRACGNEVSRSFRSVALAATCLRSLSRRGCRPCLARNEVSRPLIFAHIGGNAATGERMRCSGPARSELTALKLRIIRSSSLLCLRISQSLRWTPKFGPGAKL